MYNVLIFGTGKTSMLLERLLRYDINIVSYIDNDSSKWGNFKNGRLINSPNKIKDLNYDFILIASQYNQEIYNQLIYMKIDSHKIFQYFKFIDNIFNYYKYAMDNFITVSRKDTELLVTGISYAMNGFNTSVCCKKAYSFAFGSQDIFYDYNTVKYLLENHPNSTLNIKYLIIGLCYYSFQYDMSLSAMKNKIILYYPVLEDCHNYHEIENLYESYEINNKIAGKIFRKRNDETYDFNWQVPNLRDIKDKDKLGEAISKIDCNKNYPNTVKENIEIFNNYLELLKQHSIKPIVVVFPASKYYTKHFSKFIEDEFYFIINKFKKEYNFQYIDYFRSQLFSDEDFQDVSHLNSRGAEKFTMILNEEIEW